MPKLLNKIVKNTSEVFLGSVLNFVYEMKREGGDSK
jgi:hypothetical protein